MTQVNDGFTCWLSTKNRTPTPVDRGFAFLCKSPALLFAIFDLVKLRISGVAQAPRWHEIQRISALFLECSKLTWFVIQYS